MIEMIEVIWGSAGPGYVARGGAGGGIEEMISCIWDRWAPGPGMDFPYGLVGSENFPNCVFRIRPFFFKNFVWF